MESFIYYLKVMSGFGVIAIIYVLVQHILEKIVLFQVKKIKNIVNTKYPDTYDIHQEHFIPKSINILTNAYTMYSVGYWSFLRCESLGLGIKEAFQSWESKKMKIFKRDIDIINEFNFKKEISIIKKCYFVERFCLLLSLCIFSLILLLAIFSVVTGKHLV